jgi:hypothetical protein
MRLKARGVPLALVAVFAMSAVAASAASAAGPEFKPSTKQAFTGTSGTLKIEAGSSEAFYCSKGSSSGEITGASTVGSLVLTFTGCESKEKGGCKFKSSGAKNEGEIITTPLAGELGEVKTTEATSGVGLLVKTASGTEELALIEGHCLSSQWKLTGTVAAEVTPTKKLGKTVSLVFVGSKGHNKIWEIAVGGKHDKPELKLRGGPEWGGVSFETTETLTFKGNEVEIT